MPRTIRILAIDEEEIILKSISKALKGNGDTIYTVTTATSPLEGLRLVRSDLFDLIFVDLALSGMDGIELSRRMKNIHTAIPVVIMSGYSFETTPLNEVSRNADGLLPKPFTTVEIKSVISHILNP